MENPLKRYKERKKLTSRELAEMVELTEPFLINFLNGKSTDLKASRLLKIHEATKIPYKKLIEYCSRQKEAA